MTKDSSMLTTASVITHMNLFTSDPFPLDSLGTFPKCYNREGYRNILTSGDWLISWKIHTLLKFTSLSKSSVNDMRHNCWLATVTTKPLQLHGQSDWDFRGWVYCLLINHIIGWTSLSILRLYLLSCSCHFVIASSISGFYPNLHAPNTSSWRGG